MILAGPTRKHTRPALSTARVAFVSGDDFWTARLDGSGVQRITSGPDLSPTTQSKVRKD